MPLTVGDIARGQVGRGDGQCLALAILDLRRQVQELRPVELSIYKLPAGVYR